MLRMKLLSETYNLDVFTEDGDYFGYIEEPLLTENKVGAWRIRAKKGSVLSKIVGGGAKGVIIPHQLVKTLGDIMIISKQAVPSYKEEE